MPKSSQIRLLRTLHVEKLSPIDSARKGAPHSFETGVGHFCRPIENFVACVKPRLSLGHRTDAQILQSQGAGPQLDLSRESSWACKMPQNRDNDYFPHQLCRLVYDGFKVSSHHRLVIYGHASGEIKTGHTMTMATRRCSYTDLRTAFTLYPTNTH